MYVYVFTYYFLSFIDKSTLDPLHERINKQGLDHLLVKDYDIAGVCSVLSMNLIGFIKE